ncbi:MAG: DHH family phosphoesterase, partial [Chlamydiia bacterium]|nr:DHH family phosphoesterase [Chlamydiia bacterium]
MEDTIGPLWVEPKQDLEWRRKIEQEFNIHPVSAQILVSRGFTSFEEIHQFLYAQLPDLLDPMLMRDMEQAVDRIVRAISQGERVLIYGDNDVDGMTGTALLTEFINGVGGEALYFISARNILRQSLMVDALEYALANNCSLIITVDCGITAAAEVEEIVRRGVDVIITDHHEPTDAIPNCIATLNPKLVNSSYPNRDLTGVGVAFKLAHGVTNHLVSTGRIPSRSVDLKRYLDLVALGTISDMGALLGENRIMVRYGLAEMRRAGRVGLAKLTSVCDLDHGSLSTIDIASKIAPRLNSLGRIADPQKGVAMLLAQDEAKAEALAVELDLN